MDNIQPNNEDTLAGEPTNTVFHAAASRGTADHGWLVSQQTFSFANYHNTERMNFGTLRVLNDDYVSGGEGFGRHPHDNMEIISIPLEGDLEHKDSMGNVAVIRKGDIQVMSAGTGIMHSEYNKNPDVPSEFLQIWLFPKKRNVEPRYDQQTLDRSAMHNRLQQILSPSAADDGVWINQDAWFHLGVFDADKTVDYRIKKEGNGLYIFVIKGTATVGSQRLQQRDGFGLWDIAEVTIQITEPDTEILLMDVPMTIG